MEQARAFLTQFGGTQGYWLFFLSVMGCGIGFPMNSDLLIITASVLAAFGYFKLSLLFPIAFAALIGGDSINYWVARTYGPKILSVRPFCWILSPVKLKNGQSYLEKNGTKFLFIVRFLPLIRTCLYFTAGTLQVRPKDFYFLNIVSTIIYLAAVMNAAFYAGENIDQLIATFKQVQLFLLAGVVLTGLFFYLRKKTKSPLIS